MMIKLLNRQQTSTSAIWLLMAVNALWIVRYGLRIGAASMLAALAVYVAANLLLVRLYNKQPLLRGNAAYIAAGVLFLIVSVVISRLTDLSTLNVDRWEIIQVFWQAVADGRQPYTAQAHNGNYPGPEPMYFAMCYPFHALGVNWLMPVVAAGAMWLLGWRGTGSVSRLAVYVLLLSPSLYYEIYTLSTIYINAVVFLLWLLWTDSAPLARGWRHAVATAAVGGVVLCTRQVFLVVVALYALYLLCERRATLGRLLLWGLGMVAVWGACFLPLIAVHGWDSFLAANPFVVQDQEIFPFKYAILFAVLLVALGLTARTLQKVKFDAGVLLLAFPVASLIYWFIATEGQLFLLPEPPSDITYTIFSIPFFLNAIVSKADD